MCGYNLRKPKEAPPTDYSKPQSYTPKYLAEKILTSRGSIEGERKLVTVLFADVANYTAISEKLDPEEVHQIMDGCFKILMDEIHKYEGTINQFTGDGVMALFGAPVADEDHAQRACYAALSIQKALENYETKIKKDFGADFKMRIGLNSGPVIVGSIGDDLRMDYTAVGDTSNLASRIEQIARPGTSLVSGHTHKLAREYFEFKSLGEVEVKGKKTPPEAFELIKAGDVDTRIGASVAKGLTRFVGREKSIALLMEAFEKAQSGSGQIVGVVGDAGVGKSRLLLEFKSQLPLGEFAYFEGQCLHFGSAMAYLPILDIIRSYFEIKEGDQEHLIKNNMEDKILRLDEKLLSVLPAFHELLSLKIEDEAYQKLEPMQKREKTFEAIRDLLVRESQNCPVVLVIEDLHWIDKSSEEFLDYLIGWLAGAKILLLLLYRPEYTHPWGSKSYYNRVGLDQLTTKSSTELIQAILQNGKPESELRELIISRAAGNPLYMEEFTHTLLENGAIQCKNQKCMLIKNASEIQVPATIQGIIAARMDRLEDDLKRTMQVASVIGRDFAFRILQTITGMREELKSYLFNLQGLEFIYEKRLFPELEYVFKHALTQEVAYSSLLQKRKKEIHEKIGRAIEGLWPHRLEEFYEMLAYHYSKSENFEKTYQYSKLSGAKAVKKCSNLEAVRFYKEAIVVLGKMPEVEENKKEQFEVRLSMAHAMVYLHWPEGSLENIRVCEQLAKELGDDKSLAHYLSIFGLYYGWKKGDLLPGIKYSEDAFNKAEQINDIGLMASTGGYLCLLYWWSGKCRSVIDVAPKIITMLEKTERQSDFFGNPYNLYSVIHAWYANCSAMLGNFEEAVSLIEKGFNFALEIKNIGALAVLELQYGWLQNFKGDGKNAIEHLQNLIRYCEEGQSFLFPIAWGNLGWSHFLLGDLDTAREFVEKGLKFYRGEGVQIDLGLYYWLLGMVHLESGDLKNAQRHTEGALKISQKAQQKWIEGFAWILLGRIFGKLDQPQFEKAEECILQGIKILAELKLKTLYDQGYHYLGEVYAESNQQDKALETLKTAIGRFREMGMDYWLTKTYDMLESV
jgi:class 3 adenylate cyclase